MSSGPFQRPWLGQSASCSPHPHPVQKTAFYWLFILIKVGKGLYKTFTLSQCFCRGSYLMNFLNFTNSGRDFNHIYLILEFYLYCIINLA